MHFGKTTCDLAMTLDTPTGAALSLYIWKADGRPRGVVHINHGLAEHAARYGPFASFLAKEGFHVYAHDHRGHGHTRAPATSLGSFGPEPACENVLADVLAVHEQIAQMHPALPVILFGHSLGAMIAFAFLARHPQHVRAAALWDMPLASRLEARAAKAVLAWERFRLGSDVPSRVLPRFTFQAWARANPDARTPFDWLTRDREQVENYIADPLCGWEPTVGLWRAVFDFNMMLLDSRAAKAIPRTMPIHLLGGGSDPVTGGGKTIERLESRLRQNGFLNLETRLYPENRHESLNELNRSLIMKEFARWAAQAL